MYLTLPPCRRPLLLAACSALSVLSLSAQGMAEEPHPDNLTAEHILERMAEAPNQSLKRSVCVFDDSARNLLKRLFVFWVKS